MTKANIEAAKAALSHLDLDTNPASVRAKSRDFFWYSPVLKDRLDGVVADFAVSPKTEAEVIAAANDTPYGLAAFLWTRDIGRVFRVGEALEYGMVAVNETLTSNPATPFGGVKESGLGREGSRYGLEDFVEIKYLALGGI